LGWPDFGPNQNSWPNTEFDLPLYAVQRLADGRWLVRAPTLDPVGPRVAVLPKAKPQGAAAEQLWRCTDAQIGSRIFYECDLKYLSRAQPDELSAQSADYVLYLSSSLVLARLNHLPAEFC
jgi:hypothetical protein